MIETKALHIWAGLEQAKNNKHPYGGDIVEVYAQHLVSDETAPDPWLQAGKSLYALLDSFCCMNNVCVSVNGKSIGDWMNKYRFIHKCDVRVFKNDSEQLVKSRQNKETVVFQSKQSEKLFRKIENAILTNKRGK